MIKIGIFGGSFNPPHFGHLILAERTREILKLDKIIFIPAHIPPHKTKMHIVDPVHRLKMLKLATEGNDRFEISDIEIKRGGTSFTYDSLLYFNEKYKKAKLYLIIGMDNYHDFGHWKNYNQIFDLCRVVVLKRVFTAGKSSGKHKMLNGVHSFAGDTNNCDHVDREKFVFLDTPLLDISSTETRNRVKAQKPIDYFVPEKVKKYIEKNSLYR
jgi:nicotinate-nucleotide adenylyltransferase